VKHAALALAVAAGCGGDPAKALLWFERACQGGLKEGCEAKSGFGK
jgi:hypothetical protein